MGIYFGLRGSPLIKNKLNQLSSTMKDLFFSLLSQELIMTDKLSIELWRGFPQETLGGEKLESFHSFSQLQNTIDNWTYENLFHGVSPYKRTNRVKKPFSLHIDLHLSLNSSNGIDHVPGYISAPSEYTNVYGDLYLETFHFKDHYFDAYFHGKLPFQKKNRGKLILFFDAMKNRPIITRINAGRDINCNTNISQAFYVYRKNEKEIFNDYIRIARDYIQSHNEEGLWYPEDNLTPEEAEIIAEDLVPYDKSFLYRVFSGTEFYQTELPEFFRKQSVITVPGSVAYYRANFNSLRPIFLKTLKKLSNAIKLSLQSKITVEEKFKKALEKQHFEE